jgi:hypothetical protein
MFNGTFNEFAGDCISKFNSLKESASDWLEQYNVVHVVIASILIGYILSYAIGWGIRKIKSIRCRKPRTLELNSKEIKCISSIVKAKKVFKKGSHEGVSRESIKKRIDTIFSASNGEKTNAYTKVLLESEITNYVKEMVNAPKGAISFLQVSNEIALLKTIFHYREMVHKSNPNV